MKREIKFRAWDNRYNQMYPNVQNHINDSIWAFGNMIKDDRFSIMQYTNTKDKNGVEIYEGDIIYLEYYERLPSTKGIELKKYLRVEYFPSHAHFSAMDADGGSYSIGFSGSAVKDWRVVGNIYEHSHLLK